MSNLTNELEFLIRTHLVQLWTVIREVIHQF